MGAEVGLISLKNRSVHYGLIRPGGKSRKHFVPIGSLFDSGAMGRPKNFSRQAVLEKALPVFWRRGFADASLHELEQATGVNKSGLYSEFEDKEDLFVQSLRYYLTLKVSRRRDC